MADVGLSISLIPGPPLGPSYLITTTSPSTIFPPFIALIASSSQSKTLAGPECLSISGTTALLFTTEPFGAIFPLRIARPPVSEYGLSIVRITSGFLFVAFFIFSPTVFPVTVRQSRLRSPFLLISFITAYIPPASFRSSIYVGPAGAR